MKNFSAHFCFLFFVGLLGLLGCNSISGTCAQGEGAVWLHVVDVDRRDLSVCSTVSVSWDAGTTSGTEDVELAGGRETSELVVLLSTQSDQDFENDVPLNADTISLVVNCDSVSMFDDSISIEWTTSECDGDEIANGNIYVDIDIDTVL